MNPLEVILTVIGTFLLVLAAPLIVEQCTSEPETYYEGQTPDCPDWQAYEE